MNEKTLAIIGVVVLFSVVCVSASMAQDTSSVINILGQAAIGGGIIVTLYRLGINTEKTEIVQKNVNGVVEKRVEAAYREAYARGRLDGAKEEIEREALRQKALADAAQGILQVVPLPPPIAPAQKPGGA